METEKQDLTPHRYLCLGHGMPNMRVSEKQVFCGKECTRLHRNGFRFHPCIKCGKQWQTIDPTGRPCDDCLRATKAARKQRENQNRKQAGLHLGQAEKQAFFKAHADDSCWLCDLPFLDQVTDAVKASEDDLYKYLYRSVDHMFDASKDATAEERAAEKHLRVAHRLCNSSRHQVDRIRGGVQEYRRRLQTRITTPGVFDCLMQATCNR